MQQYTHFKSEAFSYEFNEWRHHRKHTYSVVREPSVFRSPSNDSLIFPHLSINHAMMTATTEAAMNVFLLFLAFAILLGNIVKMKNSKKNMNEPKESHLYYLYKIATVWIFVYFLFHSFSSSSFIRSTSIISIKL